MFGYKLRYGASRRNSTTRLCHRISRRLISCTVNFQLKRADLNFFIEAREPNAVGPRSECYSDDKRLGIFTTYRYWRVARVSCSSTRRVGPQLGQGEVGRGALGGLKWKIRKCECKFASHVVGMNRLKRSELRWVASRTQQGPERPEAMPNVICAKSIKVYRSCVALSGFIRCPRSLL
jgi:hypothetical protein